MEENKDKELMNNENVEIVEEAETTEEATEESVTEMADEAAKKKKVGKIIYNACLIGGILLILAGGGMLLKQYIDDQNTQKGYEDLKNEFVKDPATMAPQPAPNDSEDSSSEGSESEGPREPQWYDMIYVDVKGMQEKINPEINGWIFFENEDCSYPIVHSTDNDKYDRLTFDGQIATAGSIILDYENDADFSNRHNVIYGHNMKNLTMFGKLKWYRRNPDYWKDHQYFQILDGDRAYRYQIYSYHYVNEKEMQMVDVNYRGDYKYADFVAETLKRSKIQPGIEVTEDNKVVTLLTCTEWEETRFVVHGVLVDIHSFSQEEMGSEEENTETETAVAN